LQAGFGFLACHAGSFSMPDAWPNQNGGKTWIFSSRTENMMPNSSHVSFKKTLHLCMLVVLAAVVAWHYGRAGVLLLLGHRDASLTKLASFSRKKLAS
jgi:hypothetical protein